MSAGRLRSRALLRPFHGVRAVASPHQMTHVERLLAYAARMPSHSFFSHVSAAVAWGLPLTERAIGDSIHVSVLHPRRALSGRGVRGHALQAAATRIREHPDLGIRLTSPATTWVHLAKLVDHRYDLVAVGDAIVRTPQHRNDPPALASVAQLTTAVDAGRRQGASLLRRALSCVRDGSSSRPETWTRLVLVDAGLPEPTLGYVVRDAYGSFVARLDLAFPDRRVAVEYEGEQHLSERRQWRRDIRRYEALADLGWRVIRATSADVFRDPRTFVDRVSRALG